MHYGCGCFRLRCRQRAKPTPAIELPRRSREVGSGTGVTSKLEMVTLAGPNPQSVQSMAKPNGVFRVTSTLAKPFWMQPGSTRSSHLVGVPGPVGGGPSVVNWLKLSPKV